ncbi:MAG: 2-oxo acid dehydrogenase subunit E2, partial [Chitinophagaceae bacterium]
MIDIKVPTVGESISEVTLVKWLKKDGEYVERDQVIAELESEKATFEINAEKAGVLKTVAAEGDTLKIGDLAAQIDETASAPAGGKVEEKKVEEKKVEGGSEKVEEKPAVVETSTKPVAVVDVKATPVAAAILADKKVDVKAITPSGTGGRILKNDVLDALNNPGRKPGLEAFSRNDRNEKMSNLRRTISRRLVEAKNSTAMLTTFNEVDMSKIMEIRTKHKDKFKEIHGVNLGFMSFFTKACTYALQEWPAVNAYLDGDSIIYHDYCDISIA